MPYTQCLEREVEDDCKNEFCFRPFTLETKELIESYTKPWQMDCSDLSFANLFIWGTEGKMEFAEKNNVLYVKLDFEGVPVYIWAPINKKGADVDYRKAIMDAADYMKQAGVEPTFRSVWTPFRDMMLKACPEMFAMQMCIRDSTYIPCDLGGGSGWQCAIASQSCGGLSGTGKFAETSIILQLYGKFCVADSLYAEFVQRNI